MTTNFGKYQVLEQIGQGGFGRVFRGYDSALRRCVAIKTCTIQVQFGRCYQGAPGLIRHRGAEEMPVPAVRIDEGN